MPAKRGGGGEAGVEAWGRNGYNTLPAQSEIVSGEMGLPDCVKRWAGLLPMGTLTTSARHLPN